MVSSDSRTRAGLHPSRTAQAITSGDYPHKHNSFLIHDEQANSRTGMAEPYSTLSIRNNGLVSGVVGILDDIHNDRRCSRNGLGTRGRAVCCLERRDIYGGRNAGSCHAGC